MIICLNLSILRGNRCLKRSISDPLIFFLLEYCVILIIGEFLKDIVAMICFTSMIIKSFNPIFTSKMKVSSFVGDRGRDRLFLELYKVFDNIVWISYMIMLSFF